MAFYTNILRYKNFILHRGYYDNGERFSRKEYFQPKLFVSSKMKTEWTGLDGNPVAVSLIRGNAYQEAIAFLQNQDARSAEDEYNLGLAFEANGEIQMARKHYQLALNQDEEKQEIKDALRRTKN